MEGNIIWREEWKRPYESIWSVIENIKISNSINGNELSNYINEYSTSKSRSLGNIFKLSDEALNKLKELTKIDFLEIKANMFKLPQLDRYDPHLYFHSHLFYCGRCIQYNYHSYIHQFRLLDVCPFHLIKLQTKCENCNTDIRYFHIAKAIPYTCKCGFQLYQTSDVPIWKNWPLFVPKLKNSILRDNFYLTDHFDDL